MAAVIATAAAVLAAVAAAPAGAAPLAGTGDGVELLANVPVGAGNDVELHGDHAFVSSREIGMVVLDIRDPRHPREVGRFACSVENPELAVAPDGRTIAFAFDSPENSCHPGEQGTAVLDVSDPARPREAAWLALPRGTHTVTMGWPYLFSNQMDPAYHRLELVDLREPAAPRRVGVVDYGVDGSGPHDTFAVRREDGRRLLYAASVDRTDVIDVTDPARPRILQRIADPSIGNSHQAEPNHDGSLLLVSDEYSYGLEFPACGKLTDDFPAIGARLPFTPLMPEPGTPPISLADVGDTGALHFYALDRDGTVAGGLDGALGTFNLPFTTQVPDAGCGIHVFWQAPDVDRLVTAWYGQGVRVVDYSEPAAAREIGSFVAEGADTLVAKAHNGHIYAADRHRGLDVLRFTGSGWPATAGPAEKQLTRLQPSGRRRTGRRTGRRRVRVRVDVPAGTRVRRTLVLSVRRRGELVERLRFRRRAGRARLDFSAAGLAGRYRYTVRLGDGGRVLARGRFRVKPGTGGRRAARGRTLICRPVAR